MIIEFFGLSNSGKSVLKKHLEEKGHSVMKFEKISSTTKIMLLVKSFFLHPARNTLLFLKLNSNPLEIRNLPFNARISSSLMRNSYLASVLAKEEYLKRSSEKIYTDEYSFQSVFMILQKKASEEEIRQLISWLPKSDFLVFFRGSKILRDKAYKIRHPFRKGTLLPGSNFSEEYGKAWMDSMEYNFRILEKIISKDYKETEKFPDIIKTMDKLNREYKRKNKITLKLLPLKVYRLK
ncbi:hypothetical protein CO038_04720 [Candidatus Pacearchaeota archaeon CG_4_9_14_0_2_um_filter_39_13]|nr:hypothetical protein [Candidatus Pacearchaeota archaeon]OIO42514.1 MAG: hypothetical protein AUJ64_03925 [Candidatus Pacearchaeota archaeon CG1_02_39_14]PJC44260.1 MAG: hypothetical protein CO038_04720 [Candidatus Pacearchaeota archaeon CG_4_9_14_0_2_um_filter_39_13]